MNDRVTLEIAEGVADVRLNRPEKLNALDPAMFDALADTIAHLRTRSDVRCVVLSGAGHAFCAGLDLQSMARGAADIDLADRPHGSANRVQQAAWGWRSLPVPVIAAAHGTSYGGGLQILSGADIRIAAPDARFAILELAWGIVPDMAGFALWRAVLRDDVLRELVYTARIVVAEEARAIGLVTAVADDPLAQAMTLARTIAARNPQAIRAAKQLANLAADEAAATLLQAESAAQLGLLGSPNQLEAVRAALEKRPPRFTD